jgi:hypothetical protein
MRGLLDPAAERPGGGIRGRARRVDIVHQDSRRDGRERAKRRIALPLGAGQSALAVDGRRPQQRRARELPPLCDLAGELFGRMVAAAPGAPEVGRYERHHVGLGTRDSFDDHLRRDGGERT